jgi:hypothetical protein
MTSNTTLKLLLLQYYRSSPNWHAGNRRKFSLSTLRYKFSFSKENILRRLYTQLAVNQDVAKIYTISPYPIRVALVGAAAILGTPAFVFAGFVQLWMRYLPKQYNQVFKIGSLLILGGGLSKLSRDHIFPFLSNHSELVFPLALCNGITASFWYGIGELVFGLEAMIGLPTLASSSYLFSNSSTLLQLVSKYPIAGPTVGVLTAITSPFLWQKAFDILLPSDMKEVLFKKNHFWLHDAYDWIMFPVGVPIGALAGLSLQTALATVAKNPNGPWYNRSIPALALMSGLAAAYYNFCRSPMEDYYWYRRIDPLTGEAISLNPITNQKTPTSKLAEKAKSLRSDIGVGSDWSVIYLLRNMFTASNHRDYFTSNNYHPKIFEQGRVFDIADMEEYQDLWTMIDILIRYRFLKQSITTTASNGDLIKSRQELEKLALISLGINDLDSFAAQADNIVLDARNKRPTSATVLKSIEAMFEDATRSNKGARAQRSVLLLKANVKLYEKELFHKLGYRIPEKNAPNFISSLSTAFWIRSVTSVGIGFWIGLNFFRSYH